MDNNLGDKNFKENMTEWVKLELQIQSLKTQYNDKMKDLKNNKVEIEDFLKTYMVNKNITDHTIKTSEGDIKFVETKVSNPITYKFLKEIFIEIYNDETKADNILQVIKQKRETKNYNGLKMFFK
jgi:hypothetical protein